MNPLKCGVLECNDNKAEGRYVCEGHVPLFDRIRDELKQSNFQNGPKIGRKKKTLAETINDILEDNIE